MNKNDPPAPVPEPLSEPETEEARLLQSRLSRDGWTWRVTEALENARIFDEIRKRRKRTRESWRACVEKVAPHVSWSLFGHWRRRLQSRKGPAWERLLDRRVPPTSAKTPEGVVTAAIALRHAVPGMDPKTARERLMEQFGEKGDLGDSTLRRYWREAGLTEAPAGDASRFEESQDFHGGGALALLSAAATETGAIDALAGAVLKTGRERAASHKPPEVVTEVPGRDEEGHFTAEFNQAVREGVAEGEADCRWGTDEAKRGCKDLRRLSILTLSQAVLSQHLFAIGAIPFLTERRGFDGLDTPKGAWLEAAIPTPYQPTTLDKTLSEMALLNVGDELWLEHGKVWVQWARVWGGPDGAARWFAVYVDTTGDPYWTDKYALSGRVPRVGKVMPCLSRTAVMGGPGVPLILKGSVGAVSLKTDLINLLNEADEVLGPAGEIRRLTVVDAEAATVELLSALAERKNTDFITVLKGAAFAKLELEEAGEWEVLNKRDRIRSGWVTMEGKGAPAGGLRLRVVDRERMGSRHPHVTRFATGIPPEKMKSADVVGVYLSRWPNNEQFFRDSRNGGGLEHSHGFGGEMVTHVALGTKLENVQKTVVSAERRLEEAAAAAAHACALEARVREDKSSTPEDRKAVQVVRKSAKRTEKKQEKILEKARQELSELQTMPREIYRRDVTRENIVMALKVTMLMLVEFVLREYFGGVKMQYRTFIDYFINTPVTVRTSRHRQLFQLDANPRNPKRTEELRRACAEVTRRKLRKDGRLLVFEVVDRVRVFSLGEIR